MSQTLGELIRERRLDIGLSLGQLAAETSTSSTVVRAWEHDQSLPDEAARDALSKLLGIEESSFEHADTQTSRTVTEDHIYEEEQVPTDGSSISSDLNLEKNSGGPVTQFPSRHDELDVSAQGGTMDADADADASVETFPIVPDAPRPVPLRYPDSAPTGVAVEISESEDRSWFPLRYLFHPHKPWLYWIRAALTVLVLILLFGIFFDSVVELFDKFGEVIDSIEPTDSGGGSAPTTAGT